MKAIGLNKTQEGYIYWDMLRRLKQARELGEHETEVEVMGILQQLQATKDIEKDVKCA